MQTAKPQITNVKVVCRFRPLNQSQKNQGNEEPVHKIVSDRHLLVKNNNKQDNLTFVFDKIFDCEATQQQIFDQVGAPVLQNILDGFNGTIIAYGQTSSGKTYTIQGSNAESASKGIIPRMVENLFVAIENSSQSVEFKLKVSILELYMEKLYDLIDSSKTDLKIRESKLDGPYVQNKTEVYISDKYQLQRLVNLAQKNRVTCMTNMNSNSSRSHLIFHLTLSQFNSQTQQAKTSNLFIVDLAGSEKVSKTGAEGKVLQQAKKINLSLASLAKVIKSLSEKIPHVPYRDSKLTRIIQDALGGNSKTTLILNCSPHELNISETISTLRFGETAQKIKNKPKINREPTIQQLQNIIVKLEKQLKVKDRWIATLEAHIKTKLGTAIPKKADKLPLHEALLKQEKLFATTDGLDLNNQELIDSIMEQSMSWDTDINMNKNFGISSCNTLKIPEILSEIDHCHSYSHIENSQSSKCESNHDEQITSLEKELADCKANLQSEINKYYGLRKEYSQLNQNIKAVIQQNLSYQAKQTDLEETVASLRKLISESATKSSIGSTADQNEEQKGIRFNLSVHSEETNKDSSLSSQDILELAKLRQENKELQKETNSLKVEKELLEVKIKNKEKKIADLKAMMVQIQEQMELMAEEYEQPIAINIKLANPIKRSIIFK